MIIPRRLDREQRKTAPAARRLDHRPRTSTCTRALGAKLRRLLQADAAAWPCASGAPTPRSCWPSCSSWRPAGSRRSSDGDVVEYAVYGAPGELPALPDLRAAAGDALVEVSTSEVADDWDVRWREFHRPVVIGAPPTACACGRRGTTRSAGDVVIDPGQAFGTGAHPTTRLCLEALCGLASPAPAPLVDAGCGSGVLAIAAAQARASAPVARRSTTSARASPRRSRTPRSTASSVEARRWDLRPSRCRPRRRCVANLLRPLLLAACASRRAAADAGRLRAAGPRGRRGGRRVAARTDCARRGGSKRRLAGARAASAAERAGPPVPTVSGGSRAPASTPVERPRRPGRTACRRSGRARAGPAPAVSAGRCGALPCACPRRPQQANSDARGQRDVLAGEAVGVARAVPALMAGAHERRRRRPCRSSSAAGARRPACAG